jgi:hypothetical protein
MTDKPYAFGDIVQGHRWTIAGWERVPDAETIDLTVNDEAVPRPHDLDVPGRPLAREGVANAGHAAASEDADDAPTVAHAFEPTPIAADALSAVVTPGGDEIDERVESLPPVHVGPDPRTGPTIDLRTPQADAAPPPLGWYPGHAPTSAP